MSDKKVTDLGNIVRLAAILRMMLARPSRSYFPGLANLSFLLAPGLISINHVLFRPVGYPSGRPSH